LEAIFVPGSDGVEARHDGGVLGQEVAVAAQAVVGRVEFDHLVGGGGDEGIAVGLEEVCDLVFVFWGVGERLV